MDRPVAALITASGVAVAGVIGFVGLIVPHGVRLVAGSDHRLLLPLSFLAARDIEAGDLVRVLPDHEVAGASLHVVYPSARYVPRRVAVFRDFLIDALTPPPWEACMKRRKR